MPTPHLTLSQTAENARKKPNLTPEERKNIVDKSNAGLSTAELMAEFGRDASTITRTIKNHRQRSTTQEAPRSGRPSLLSHHQKKLISRAVRKKPRMKYSELTEVAKIVVPDGTSTCSPSRSTIYRYLKNKPGDPDPRTWRKPCKHDGISKPSDQQRAGEPQTGPALAPRGN